MVIANYKTKGTKMKQTHPLKNPESSKHYDAEPGGKSAIENFEERFTVKQLFDWALLTEEKYMYRLYRKGQEDSDLKKAETYRNYHKMLKQIIDKYPTLADMTAKTAYNHLGYRWEY